MSALGQKRPFAISRANVRFAPEAVIPGGARHAALGYQLLGGYGGSLRQFL